ncbi:hypothetical protein ES332_D12G091900v1 [Gossypium tomentosum]|uniref:Uncharacterized protein n=1 Tax=Gossypium tomentosum TaxID=34277 RepID=A0A5D2I8F8_GOSTO|nr:hypothetical protein ES332_D12G091900v1 [Gossypium tomentosum]TYH38170.1 hypothetical protein ES332_D12G091900v1 [Gossypium tomentosum]
MKRLNLSSQLATDLYQIIIKAHLMLSPDNKGRYKFPRRNPPKRLSATLCFPKNSPLSKSVQNATYQLS